MATAAFNLELPPGLDSAVDGDNLRIFDDALTWDGEGYTGADGTYDTWVATPQALYTHTEVEIDTSVPVDPDPDPVDEPASAVFQLDVSAPYAYVIVAEGYSDYIIQGWETDPVPGVSRIVYDATGGIELSPTLELVIPEGAEPPSEWELWHVSGAGLYTYAPITNLDQLPVADAPTLDAPTLVSEIPNQTATEGEAFSLDLAPFFDGDEITYSVTGWPAAAVTGSTLSVTPTEADVTASPISVTATATNSAGSVSSTFSVTVEAAAVPAVPEFAPMFGLVIRTQTTASIPVSYPGTDFDSIEYSVDGGAYQSVTPPIQLTELTPATTYTLRARARNEIGAGPVAIIGVRTLGIPAEPGQDSWPFSKGIRPAIPVTWEYGKRHPKTGMRARMHKKGGA